MYVPPISTLKIFGCYCPRLYLWRSLQDFEHCRFKSVLAKKYLFVVRDRFAAANMHFAATGVLLQRALCSDRCTEPCKFPSLDSYQMFLWTHKEVDLAPHQVVGLLLQVGVAEKFPHVVGFESLDSFFRVSKQDSCFTAVEEGGGR